MTKDNLLTDDEFEELIDMAKSKNKYTAVSINIEKNKQNVNGGQEI